VSMLHIFLHPCCYGQAIQARGLVIDQDFSPGYYCKWVQSLHMMPQGMARH